MLSKIQHLRDQITGYSLWTGNPWVEYFFGESSSEAVRAEIWHGVIAVSNWLLEVTLLQGYLGKTT